MKIKEISNYLESLAPLGSQASYDNCGLIVGDKEREVTAILTCLDCTEAIIEEALRLGCNLIVAHHPIVFSGLKKLTGKNYIERTVIKAIENKIAIYAIHTNFDNYRFGVNFEIGTKLGLENLRTLDPAKDVLSKLIVFVPTDAALTVSKALFAAGAGAIGNYADCAFEQEGKGSFTPLENAQPTEGKVGLTSRVDETKLEVLVSNHLLPAILGAMYKAHPYEEVAHDIIALKNTHPYEGSGMVGTLPESMGEELFLRLLKSTFNCGIIRHTALLHKPIKTVAFCGGSGSFLLSKAKAVQADIFVTADYKYHEFFDAENQLVIADIGHYESEQFTTKLLARILKKKFPTFAVHKTEEITNPINYF